MLAESQTGIYVASGILFLLPSSLLFVAWSRLPLVEAALATARWRKYVAKSGMLTASLSTLVNIIWNASWLHNGGSPHGMGAAPGIWQSLGPLLVWTFGIATFSSLFGKGKFRILMLGWSLSMFFVFQMVYILQID